MEGCRLKEERVVYTCAPVTELSGRDAKASETKGSGRIEGWFISSRLMIVGGT
jgi:hypothetical protein